MLDNKKLAEIQARVDAASAGPWKAFIEDRDQTSGSSFIMVGEGQQRGEDIELSGATTADYDFIAHARQDVPVLIEEVRRLNALLERTQDRR